MSQLAHVDLLRYVPTDVVLSWVGTDRRRASRVAQLCRPHGETLDEVTRQLLVRFGPRGEVARVLGRRARSAPGAVWGGMSAFTRQQREHASLWVHDAEPAVRDWAQRQEEGFRHAAEEDEERQEFRRKYG